MLRKEITTKHKTALEPPLPYLFSVWRCLEVSSEQLCSYFVVILHQLTF